MTMFSGLRVVGYYSYIVTTVNLLWLLIYCTIADSIDIEALSFFKFFLVPIALLDYYVVVVAKPPW